MTDTDFHEYLLRHQYMLIEDDAYDYGMRVNPIKKEEISEKLIKAQKDYGERYCPCAVQRTEDTVCPCKNMREKNACRCGLFLPKEV